MSGGTLTLRVKARTGHHVLRHLTTHSPLCQLTEAVSSLTAIPAATLRILCGYPPTPLDLTSPQKDLGSLNISSGETLIIEEAAQAPQAEPPPAATPSGTMATPIKGTLMRRVVPANNSCLFTSVHCCLSGDLDLSCADPMRKLIASQVCKDPSTYSTALLGRANKDYCSWIKKNDSWGGAIEISILSLHYGVEIDVVDTQTGRIDRFGEDRNCGNRILLIYDGIHYDPLIMESLNPASGAPPTTIFSCSEDNVLIQAQEIAEEAKASRQFTDVAKFSLRCLVCQKPLTGQAEAEKHAAETSHINFGEV